MGAEKCLAFGESWNAMIVQSVLENQRVAISAIVVLVPVAAALFLLGQLGHAKGILGAGLAPVHRRARANARRLGRRRTRR